MSETPRPPAPTAPPPPGVRPARRLVRRTDRRVVAGVASGLADYFGTDPAVVRIVFVVLTFVAGAGPLLYVLAWLFVPAAGTGESIAQGVLRRPAGLRTYLGVALVIAAVAILASAVSRPGIIWAFALIAFGVFLFREEPAPAAPRPPGGTLPPSGQPAAAAVVSPAGAGTAPATEPVDPVAAPGAGATVATVGPAAATASQPADPAAAPGWDAGPAVQPFDRPAPPGAWDAGGTVTEPLDQPPSPGAPPPRWEPPPGWGAPPPPRPRRPRSPLGPITLGAAFVATGVGVVLDNLGVVDLTVGRALALFLTVLGLGLLVGAWFGRAWSLILLGLVLVPFVAAAGLLGSESLGGGMGDRLWQPRTPAEIRPAYQLGGGELILDLSRVRLGPQPTHVDVGLGAGHLVVVVPDDAPVDLRGRVGVGGVRLLGQDAGLFGRDPDQGVRVESTLIEGASKPRRGDPPGRLTLDLHAGYGVIEVFRTSYWADRQAGAPGYQPTPTTTTEVP